MSSKKDKPVHGAVVIFTWTAIILAIIFFVLGSWGFFDSGNGSDRECYDYQNADGDWANTCD
jgi:hypothetical protein